MLRRSSTVAATLLLTILTGSPALAETLSRVVHYGDLDLTNRVGVKTLRSRVYRAANWVCSLPETSGSILPPVDQNCHREAMAAAEPRIQRAVIDAARTVTDIELAAR